ncbi:hypothetical protein NBRGN_024_00720 [Nocardia brasiliensis NBRC 14402]|nr:LLM class flavin-dependent oxidoreductase [Nocardia brasiliensis]ASF07129.1 LLM class flavin-dependent oxidoreductase [Nocardia brasiliensis]GAJ80206.1 hypothetical protein NBRGN_024_00720 [Nocardia brasiliensis NBRC 14402]SUB47605.1 probable F420-dependent oxidoreductase, Rv2161c family [Nocardia brasiliensis]
MQFGVSIPNFGAAVSGERLAEWGSGCERLGFDLAMVTDHLAQPADVRRAYPEDFYESFATLAYLAALTRTIKVGTPLGPSPRSTNSVAAESFSVSASAAPSSSTARSVSTFAVAVPSRTNT